MCFFRVEICILIVLTAAGSIVTASDASEPTTVLATESSVASTVMTTLKTSEATSTPTTTSSSISTSSSTKSPIPPPIALPLCSELSVMPNIDLLALSGTWYELARKGYGTFIQNLQCLEMNISYMNGTAMVFQTFAPDLNSIRNQSVYEYIVQYNKTNPSDYNITNTNYDDLPVPIYKILDTDYENYLVVCSYIKVWEKSAAAFVYFRDRTTSNNIVYAVVDEAATKYGDFNNMNLVYQGPRCNSVSRALPTGRMAFVLFAVYLLKYIRN